MSTFMDSRVEHVAADVVMLDSIIDAKSARVAWGFFIHIRNARGCSSVNTHQDVGDEEVHEDRLRKGSCDRRAVG